MPNCSPVAVIPPVQDWLRNPPTSHPSDSEYMKADMKSNPDISGIGVFTGFVSTAYTVFVLLLSNYLYAYDPVKDPFDPNDGNVPSSWKANPIDVKFLSFFRKRLGIKSPSSRMQQIFDECILTICDIQLVTGFAMLISAFSQLSPKETSGGVHLSAYHWYLVASVAWSSTVTHLSGLTVIRSYLHQNRALNTLRIVLMVTLLVIVVLAQIPTGYFNWVSVIWFHPTAALPMSPAACYLNIPTAQRLWNENCVLMGGSFPGIDGVRAFFCLPVEDMAPDVVSSEAMQSMIFSVCILLLAFATRCLRLSAALSKRFDSVILQPSKYLATAYLRAVVSIPTLISVMASNAPTKQVIESLCETALVLPLLSIYISSKLITYLLSSMFSEVIWTFFVLIWGTFKLAEIRSGSRQVPTAVIEDENEWTFGQVMAIVLVASPFLPMICKLSVGMKKPAYNSRPIWNQQSQVPSVSGNPSPQRYRIAVATRGSETIAKLRVELLGASWMSPVVASSIIVPLVITFSILLSESILGHRTLTLGDFWFSTFTFSAYLFYGYPSACGLTIFVALNLEDWSRNHPVSKWFLFAFVDLIGHGGYIGFCSFSGMPFLPRAQKTIGQLLIPPITWLFCIVIFLSARLISGLARRRGSRQLRIFRSQ